MFEENLEKTYRPPLLLDCSPRIGGNSNWASEESARLLQDLGFETKLLSLRDFKITPCIGCDLCKGKLSLKNGQLKVNSRYYLGCPLSLSDSSEELLKNIIEAPALYLFSPIYHYHLPASFKGLLDRLQPFYWIESAADKHLPEVSKPCFTVLQAGRPKGAKLFDGSMLTIKYSMAGVSFRTEKTLGLRGLDKKKDFLESKEARAELEAYISYSAELIKNYCHR